MNTTLPVAISVPLTALLVAVAAIHVLGPAQAADLPRPQPGVSPVEPADPGVIDAPGGRYLAKKQEMLKHLLGAQRPDVGATDEPVAVVVTNGVPRDSHGDAYLGKQPEILRHL